MTRRLDEVKDTAEQVGQLPDEYVADFLNALSIHLEKARGPNLEVAVNRIAECMGERARLLIRELSNRSGG